MIDTGDGRAAVLDFDYRRPPAPSRPTRLGLWRKRALDRLYFPMIARARV